MQYPYALSRIPVPASTACAVPTWSAGLTSRSQLSHASLLPSLPDFLELGTERSCALWKASLKIYQLHSAPLSLRTIPQGVLLTNSLKSWKLAFLKFSVLTVLLAFPIPLRTANVKEPLPTMLTHSRGAENKDQPLLCDWGSVTTKWLGAKMVYEI